MSNKTHWTPADVEAANERLRAAGERHLAEKAQAEQTSNPELKPAKKGLKATKSRGATEAKIQKRLVLNVWREFRVKLIHIPNGSKLTESGKREMGARGVRSGFPDLLLPIPKRKKTGEIEFCGLFIELKRDEQAWRETEAKHKALQEDWVAYLNKQGYKAEICIGYEAAKKLIDWYLA